MTTAMAQDYRKAAEESVERGDVREAGVWALLYVGIELTTVRHELERLRRNSR